MRTLEDRSVVPLICLHVISKPRSHHDEGRAGRTYQRRQDASNQQLSRASCKILLDSFHLLRWKYRKWRSPRQSFSRRRAPILVTLVRHIETQHGK